MTVGILTKRLAIRPEIGQYSLSFSTSNALGAGPPGMHAAKEFSYSKVWHKLLGIEWSNRAYPMINLKCLD
jgi:hypothetical protein